MSFLGPKNESTVDTETEEKIKTALEEVRPMLVQYINFGNVCFCPDRDRDSRSCITGLARHH